MDIDLQIGKLGDVFLEFSGQPGKDRDVIETIFWYISCCKWITKIIGYIVS